VPVLIPDRQQKPSLCLDLTMPAPLQQYLRSISGSSTRCLRVTGELPGKSDRHGKGLTRKWLRRTISCQNLQPLAQENSKVKSAKSVHNAPGVELLLPQVVDTHLNGEIERIDNVQQSFGQMRSTPGDQHLPGSKRHACRITTPQRFSAPHVEMQSDICQAEQ
jgi:hypothetical protein